MSKRFVSLSASAALILAAVVISARAEPVAIHGVKTVGALTLESRGLAVGPRDVLRQGGLATAGAVRWEPASAIEAKPQSAIHGVKTVGALTLESRGLATGPRDVIRQGGLATAGTARWVPAPAEVNTAAFTGAGTVGALRLETLGLATSASGVHLQGGAVSARAVRWTSAPAK